MKPKLSIVTTLYNSDQYLTEFYERITKAAKDLTDDYNIIFVNDGSPDNSLQTVLELYKKDTKVIVVDLSRNFGHHKAIMAGLSYANGDYVFLIDCDLEEDPDLLLTFYAQLHAVQCDVVYGVVNERKQGWILNKLSSMAISVYKAISDIKSPKGQATVRLMSQRYVTSLLEFHEQELFLEGIFYLVGYEQYPVLIEKSCKGSTAYSIKKRINLFVNALCSFSMKPLLYTFFIGVFVFFVSSFLSIYFIIRKVCFGHLVSGWTSMMLSTWVLGGIIISCLGVVALYLSKIFIEIKMRPRLIVRNIYARNDFNHQKEKI